MKKRPYFKKKPFLLVEVIVGLTIFALCALPLISQPFKQTESSMNQLFESQLARHAENSRCALLADLHAGNIPWTSLLKTPLALPSAPCEIDLGEGIKKHYTQAIKITLEKEKKTTEQQKALLLKLLFTYTPKGEKKSRKDLKYLYFVTVVVPALSA